MRYAAGNTPYWNGTNWITNSSNIYNNGGNVGIGTGSPQAQLELADIYSGGGKNLLIGDDAYFTDIDQVDVLGLYGNQNNDRAGIKLGSGGPVIWGQNDNIGIGTTMPVAKLDVQGNVKIADGSQGAGKVLTSDANGLATWSVPNTGSCGYSIGQNVPALGGIIFYLDPSGCHGLVSTTTNQANIQWQNICCYSNTTAYNSSVGAGHANTSMIVYNQGAGSYAAEICYNLNSGGFTDWYLPSWYELKLMYSNIGQGNLLGLGNVGTFTSADYWSSTEDVMGKAWRISFSVGGNSDNANKDNTMFVRAIRAF